MCEAVEGVCHSVELWMPDNPLLVLVISFILLYLFIRFLARSIPALGI